MRPCRTRPLPMRPGRAGSVAGQPPRRERRPRRPGTAASTAALVVPAPGCGRTGKAASPSRATRSNTICGVSMSKIAWKNGRGSFSKIHDTCGATRSRPAAWPRR